MHNPFFIVLESSQTYDYSGLMQGIGLGVIALFTPIAFFILDSFKNQKEGEIDKLVLIDQVLEPKKFILSLSLIFIPQFFYKFEGLRFFVFLLFILGFVLICIILRNCYLWFKCVESEDDDHFRNQCRNRYYENNKHWINKKNVWSLTWQADIIASTEVNRFNKFIIDVEQLMSEGKFEMANSYLASFNVFIEKRHLGDWNLFKVLWSNILDWHFKYCTPEIPEVPDLSRMALQGTINTILNKVFESSLINNTAFLCFKELKTHLSGKDWDYMNRLLLMPTQLFFENIAKSSSKHDIWHHYFPSEWKITMSNLSQKNDDVVNIWFNRFINWAGGRIGGITDFDPDLDAVIYGLFPSVDVATWSRILQYVFNGWINNKRMQSLVDSRRAFGFISHAVSYSSSTEINIAKIMNNKILATYELAMRFFPSEFTKERLTVYLVELEALEGHYTFESYQENNRLNYIDLFKGILEQLP